MRQVVLLVMCAAVLASVGCASSKDSKPARVVEVKAVEAQAVETPADPSAKPVAETAVAVDKSAGAIAPGEIEGLPGYPGASRTKLDTATGSSYEWSRRTKVELETRDPFEKVKSFYEKVIRDFGWQVTGLKEKTDEIGWRLAKDGAVADVRIEKKDKKRVEIRLERKDR